MPKWAKILLLFAGLALLIGFTIGRQPLKGIAYLADRPEMCVACHVMKPHYEGWYHSAHRHVVCNECHTPADFLGKYYTKARVGLHDAWVYFVGPLPANYRAKPKTKEIIQANCTRCHQDYIATIGDTRANGGRFCFDCHRSTPHGRETGLETQITLSDKY